MISKLVIWLIALITLINISYAVDLCPSSLYTSSVYVQYANLTPATNATVTLTLWNGTSILMNNVGGGLYNYTYYVPGYNENGFNTYTNYFNSSDPTTNGTEDLLVAGNLVVDGGLIQRSAIQSSVILLHHHRQPVIPPGSDNRSSGSSTRRSSMSRRAYRRPV